MDAEKLSATALKPKRNEPKYKQIASTLNNRYGNQKSTDLINGRQKSEKRAKNKHKYFDNRKRERE